MHASASDGTLDASFNTGAGFAPSGTVSVLARQPDGKVLVGGTFTSYKGIAANRIIRLNADGSRDETFDIGTGISGGASPGVFALVLQPDGKVLVGGSFSAYDGATTNMLVRLNADGSRDETFTSLFTGISTLTALALQPDGKYIVGGNFIAYGADTPSRIMRLNADGTLDTSFDIGTGFAAATVRTVALQSDGKVIVGGDFASFDGTTANRLARLNTDGSIDEDFDTGTGFSIGGTGGTVRAITLDDGKILVGGSFTLYGSTTANRIIRLNADGSVDGSFNPGTGFGNNIVSSIAVDGNGKILVGGSFTSFNATTTNRIVSLNADGTRDDMFDAGSGFNSTLNALLIDPDDNVLAGGAFTTYNGTTTGAVVRLGFAAPAIAFSADSDTVAYDGSVELSWNVTGYVDSCTASGDWSGSKASSGTETVENLTGDSTFTLSCTGPGGTAEEDASITVGDPIAPVITFTADHDTVPSGGTAELTWSVANLYDGTCTASEDWSGAKPSAGTETTAALDSESTFTLSCTGPGGTAEDSVTIALESEPRRSSSHSSGGSGGGRARTVTPASSVPVILPESPAYLFTKTLRRGMTDTDVYHLQQYLNAHGFAVAPSPLPGSLANETHYFGPATEAALIKFQEANASVILRPIHLTRGTGFFGTMSMAVANGQ
ncbi:MAG: peptidoglycan-binding protein [bacterium]